MKHLRTGVFVLVAVAASVVPAKATVEMQIEAKKLGYHLTNCLYCHAASHSVEVMKQKAKALNMNDGNCLACHGANVPAKLNGRGEWLVAEKKRRRAKDCQMAWLRDYKEPTPAPATRHGTQTMPH